MKLGTLEGFFLIEFETIWMALVSFWVEFGKIWGPLKVFLEAPEGFFVVEFITILGALMSFLGRIFNNRGTLKVFFDEFGVPEGRNLKQL